jgi:hypothetical protein
MAMATRSFLGEETLEGRRCLVMLEDRADEGRSETRLYIDIETGSCCAGSGDGSFVTTLPSGRRTVCEGRRRENQ